jgi:hypothetical protein
MKLKFHMGIKENKLSKKKGTKGKIYHLGDGIVHCLAIRHEHRDQRMLHVERLMHHVAQIYLPR